MNESIQILLVDDSPFDRTLARRELTREFENAEIVEVVNETEFESVLQSKHFDLVITDYQIHWTNGLEVLKQVKAQNPNCPVLMFTATGDEEVAVEAMKNGLADYVVKNMHHIARLPAAARSALENARTHMRAENLENRLAFLVSRLQIGVFRRDANGTIIECNEAAAKILGWKSSEDLVGRNMNDFVDDSAFASRIEFRSEILHDKEFFAVRPDATNAWLSVNETDTDNDDGNRRIEGFIEDVSQRKANEESIMQLQQEMAYASRVQSVAEMAGGISHELTQPLTIITNYASLCIDALAEVEAATEQLPWLQQIHDLALESGQVVRSLNEFTQHHPWKPVDTDLCELLKTSLEMLRFEIRKTDTQLTSEFSHDSIECVVDPIQIRQVVFNLARNAMLSMKENDAADRRLTVSLQKNNEGCLICLRDSGQEIPAGQERRLFEPFVAGRNEGAGMGLSISARIVKAHGGTIEAFNNPDDVGASFQFFLPSDVSVDESP